MIFFDHNMKDYLRIGLLAKLRKKYEENREKYI